MVQMQRKRLVDQSAIEYLLTYGWAMLAIAVMLTTLYLLGVFGRISLPFVCIADPQFSCTNEIMNSGGGITATFGYTGSMGPITITGLACNSTLTAPPRPPSIESSHISVNPGQAVQVTFQCPTNGQLQLGESLPVNLWFYYNTANESGLEQHYARGWVKVNYESLIWNITEWTPSSNGVQLLPYSSVAANPEAPSGTDVPNSSVWTSLQGSGGSGWAYGTDYHNHDIYLGMGVTLFPIAPLSLDNAPCSPPYASHGYTAVAYANMSGSYNFTTVTDDGTEIFYREVGSATWQSVFGGAAWKSQAPTQYSQVVSVPHGEYELVVDYTDVCDPAGVSVVTISPPPSPISGG